MYSLTCVLKRGPPPPFFPVQSIQVIPILFHIKAHSFLAFLPFTIYFDRTSLCSSRGKHRKSNPLMVILWDFPYFSTYVSISDLKTIVATVVELYVKNGLMCWRLQSCPESRSTLIISIFHECFCSMIMAKCCPFHRYE